MRVSMKDIAAMVGVSKTTISLYLNNHPHSRCITDATKKKIDKAIKETGYQVSVTARALSKGKTKTLGFVIGGIANDYFSHFAEFALEESAKHDYQLLLSLTRWNKAEEQRCLDNLINRQTDGILYYPNFNDKTDLAKTLKSRNYPLLLINQTSTLFPYVSPESIQSLNTAVNELKKLGHHNVFGIFGNPAWEQSFNEACISNDLIPELNKFPLANSQQRHKAVREILKLKPESMIIRGRLTAGLLLKEIERHCPDYHPSIILNYDFACDFLDNSRLKGIIFTDTKKIAVESVRMLIKMIEQNNSNPDSILIPTKYIPAGRFSELQVYDCD